MYRCCTVRYRTVPDCAVPYRSLSAIFPSLLIVPPLLDMIKSSASNAIGCYHHPLILANTRLIILTPIIRICPSSSAHTRHQMVVLCHIAPPLGLSATMHYRVELDRKALSSVHVFSTFLLCSTRAWIMRPGIRGVKAESLMVCI